jgi:adenylate cyclase
VGEGHINKTNSETGTKRTRWAIGRFLPIVLGGLIAIAILPVILVGFLGTQDVSRRLLRDRGDLLIEAVVTPIEDLLTPVAQQVEETANLIGRGEIDPENDAQFATFVRGLMAPTPQVTSIAFASPDGTVRHWPQDAEGRPVDRSVDLRKEAVSETLRGESGHWSEPFVSSVSGQIVLTYRTPVLRDGNLVGLISAAVSTSRISQALSQIGKQFEVVPFVLSNRTEIVAHPTMASLPFLRSVAASGQLPTVGNIGDPVMAAIWTDENPITESDPLRLASGHWSPIDGVPYTYVYRNLPMPSEAGLLAGVYFASAVNRRDRWMSYVVAGIGTALLLAAVLAATRVARSLARPITDFGEASRAIGDFDFRERGLDRWEKSRVDEVASTATAIRKTARALSAFERYVPKSLVRQLISLGSESSRPAKREMSVLFLDLEGYTRYAKNRSANEVSEYLGVVFSRIGPIIEECGGTIDKYTGDGLMAFWGAPLPDEQHARHAVDAALMISERLSRFIEDSHAGCRLRIGIHSGDAVVGDLGYGERMNYTVVGDTVNTAKRTETAARGIAPNVPVIIVVTPGVVAMAGLSPDEVPMAPIIGGRLQLLGAGALAVREEEKNVEASSVGTA